MWIVCQDKTVRKQQGSQFVVLFSLDSVDYPQYIATRRTNKLLINKYSQNRVEEYEERESQWKLSQSFSSSFNRPFNYPTGVAVDSTDRLIICDYGNHRVVVKRGEDGEDLIDLSSRFTFEYPIAVAVDGMDNIFVAELRSKRVVVFDREGNHLNTFHHSLDDVYYIVVMENRSVYVSHNAPNSKFAEIKLD